MAPPDFETHETGTHRKLEMSVMERQVMRDALKMALEIWDEYMSQIATCVSQDYGRLNEFPMVCSNLGLTIKDGKVVDAEAE